MTTQQHVRTVALKFEPITNSARTAERYLKNMLCATGIQQIPHLESVSSVPCCSVHSAGVEFRTVSCVTNTTHVKYTKEWHESLAVVMQSK